MRALAAVERGNAFLVLLCVHLSFHDVDTRKNQGLPHGPSSTSTYIFLEENAHTA